MKHYTYKIMFTNRKRVSFLFFFFNSITRIFSFCYNSMKNYGTFYDGTFCKKMDFSRQLFSQKKTQSAFTCSKLTIGTRCEICLKITIKTIGKYHQRCLHDFNQNSETVQPFHLVLLLLILNIFQANPCLNCFLETCLGLKGL